VGFDAGTTAAIAVVNYEGELVSLWSKRNASFSDVLLQAAKRHVTIVASDRKPPARQCKRLAAALKTKLFAPRQPLSKEFKLSCTKGYACANQHERDALAAALKAYHVLVENKARKIRKRGGSTLVQRMVLEGRRFTELVYRHSPPQRLKR